MPARRRRKASRHCLDEMSKASATRRIVGSSRTQTDLVRWVFLGTIVDHLGPHPRFGTAASGAPAQALYSSFSQRTRQSIHIGSLVHAAKSLFLALIQRRRGNRSQDSIRTPNLSQPRLRHHVRSHDIIVIMTSKKTVSTRMYDSNRF